MSVNREPIRLLLAHPSDEMQLLLKLSAKTGAEVAVRRDRGVYSLVAEKGRKKVKMNLTCVLDQLDDDDPFDAMEDTVPPILLPTSPRKFGILISSQDIEVKTSLALVDLLKLA